MKLSFKHIKPVFVFILLGFFNLGFAQVASFTTSIDSGCSPVTIVFTNTSTGAASYLWRFGDGNTSTLTNPGAIYTNPGQYTVTLIAKNGSAGIDSVVKANLITVFKKPKANFYANPTSRCAPVTVLFHDTTTPGAGVEANWLWDFGDGNISLFQNPTHVYQSAGKYTIKFFVTDIHTCTDTIVKRNYIFLSQPSIGSFTASDSSACVPPLAVNFKSSIVSKLGGVLKYDWDFGDGSSSTLQNPKHTYASGGNFTVTLSATDSANCTGTFTKLNYININRDTAMFTYNRTLGCPPLKVSFTNTTSPLAPGSKFLWNYGDGSTSTAKDTVHFYNTPGTYSVKLLVISPSGCTDSIIDTNIITVKAAPDVNFAALDTANCQAPVTVRFFDSTVGGGLFWRWNFGDGAASNTQNPSHLYNKAGNFNISLTATGLNGCATTLTKAAFVKISPPRAKISPVPPNGCAPMQVHFYDSTQSVDPLVAWHWVFGDAAANPAGSDTSDVENPLYTYKNTGKYIVTLSVLTKGGCRDTIHYCCIQSGIKPESDFTAAPATHCFSDTGYVRFTNLTNTHPVPADSFFWSFGYGGVSYLENPKDRYHTKPTQYTVTLVSFNNGCPDSLVKKNYITVEPPYSIFLYSQPKCNPDSVYFTDSSVEATSIKWSFGDGDTTAPLAPHKVLLHVYKDTGVYTVMHWAYNDTAGCRDSTTQQIPVFQPPAGFTASDSTGCLPLTVRFSSINTAPGNTYLWNFGNGDSSINSRPAEIYTEPGGFTVTLKIKTASGCLLQTIKKKYINPSGPYSNFAISPTTGCLPFNTVFADSSTSVFPISSSVLALGDGRKINITTETQSIVYDSVPKNQNIGYSVTLYVTDTKGCTGSKTLTVQPAHPVASFTAKLADACQSKIYDFITPPQSLLGLLPLTYYWNFGNGSISTLANPSTVYNSIGKYTASLMLTDADGCTDSISQNINVLQKLPKAGFRASKITSNCPPLIDSFFDTSLIRSGGIAEWFWNFGDGSTSNIKDPIKVYNSSGSFTVSLIIIDSFGCSDSVTYPSLVTIKGPTGAFTDSPATGGCSPLTVQFKVKSKNAVKYEWDFGDGNIVYTTNDTITKIYYHNTYSPQLPIGYYKPGLILTDINNCSYTVPAHDSIAVYPPPQPNEVHSPSCFGYPTYFTDSSLALVGKIVKWVWDFGDSSAVSFKQNPSHTYLYPNIYNFSLVVTSSFGCENTISKKIKIGGIKARYGPLDSNACVGRPFYFKDESVSDTSIVSWLWVFGDGDSSRLQNPAHTFYNKGLFSIKLFVSDAKGCSDTLRKPPLFIVGDTAPPPTPPIYRVTVNNNDTVQIDFAKASLLDFYEYEIFRATPSGYVKVANSFNINDTSLLDVGASNLVSSFCYKIRLLNFCGYTSLLDSSRTHCTIFLSTLSDTNSVMLNWSSYIGWDNVKRYIIYKKNALDSFVPLASVNGNINTYIDSSAYCTGKYTYKIEAIKAGNDSQIVSWSDTAVGSPIYPPYVVPNQIVTVSDTNNKNIWIEWNNQPKVKARGYLLYKSTDGKVYNQVGGLFGRDTFSTIDSAVQINSQSYYYEVKLEDICGDLSGYSNLGKSILLNADTNLELQPYLTWSAYTDWPEGVEAYIIQLKDEKGNWNFLDSVDGNTFGYVDNITDLNSMPSYCYRVIARRNAPYTLVTSESNEGCVKVRATVFVPNAFTPNHDGRNDVFQIKGLYISNFDLKIYNRWGQFLFETKSLDEGWDGTYNGQKCPMDVYLWTLNLNGVDKTSHFISGTVTLMR